ncbi:ABC transporter permease [Oryzicola mucosus]|uniref:ABC transporter permease n=1 Tax=Oryzicola mucosus TaxID=2767425 RepID=A0A8J6Q5D0_9HYPH|nr:ABC transporter permease [Oryzicola mucosus]MBD0417440.1 ABC transporter permease [Oryzicola mucosus]
MPNIARDQARSERAAKFRALMLVVPILLFLLVVFIGPVVKLLSRSVDDRDVASALPQTAQALAEWRWGTPLPDAAYGAMVGDLRAASTPANLAPAAGRLNYSLPGMRALLMTTRTKLQALDRPEADPKSILISLSAKWAEPATWANIRQAAGPITDFYLLTAVDLKRDFDGSIARVPPSQSSFLPSIRTTFVIAFTVTLLAIVFGFPFAYLMASATERVAGIMMFVVLLPFLTATMVRILAWGILLGREGVINYGLLSSGLVDGPLDLLYNRTAVNIALLHIFVPYMILPLYSVMKTVPLSHMRAAASLGAPPFTAFRRVYLPQIAPGLAAGSLLVFIQCLGVFVVPAILGGAQEQGLPSLIAHYVNKTLNWGLAAALSVILLVSVYLVYWLFVTLTKSASLSLGTR